MEFLKDDSWKENPQMDSGCTTIYISAMYINSLNGPIQISNFLIFDFSIIEIFKNCNQNISISLASSFTSFFFVLFFFDECFLRLKNLFFNLYFLSFWKYPAGSCIVCPNSNSEASVATSSTSLLSIGQASDSEEWISAHLPS